MSIQDSLIRTGIGMKLLIITGLHPTRSNLSGGIFITRNIQKLYEFGIQCDIISFYYQDSLIIRLLKFLLSRRFEEVTETIKIGKIEYVFLPIKMSFLDRVFYHDRIGEKMANSIKTELNLNEYNLIHAHWVYPHGYAASLLSTETGIPCIISAHGSDIHSQPYRSPKTIPAIIYALDHAAMVIFNSGSLLDAAKELGYTGNNYNVIPIGVETSVFIPMVKEKVRNDLSLPASRSAYVGFVGNLTGVKGADRLPEIFRAVANKRKNTQFIIIGDGDLRQDIEKKCMQYHLNVIFKGRIDPDEMPQWMNALDVLVLPSRKEGFGSVILEAQSCGRPVVGSNTGGIPEAIGPGGIVIDTGLGFEENFADAVIEMLTNPPLVEKLRERAVQFDWDRITRKQIEIYESQI